MPVGHTTKFEITKINETKFLSADCMCGVLHVVILPSAKAQPRWNAGHKWKYFPACSLIVWRVVSLLVGVSMYYHKLCGHRGRDFLSCRTSGNLEPLEAPNSSAGRDESAQALFSIMYADEDSDGDVSTAQCTPPMPKPSAPSEHTSGTAGGTKKRKKYENEIASLTEMISKQTDEAEHFGLVVASRVRRYPERLQGQLQALILTTITNFEEEVVYRC